jgi:hypothetical protein
MRPLIDDGWFLHAWEKWHGTRRKPWVRVDWYDELARGVCHHGFMLG